MNPFKEKEFNDNLLRFSRQQLREFDGYDDKPIYIALNRTVYDITSHSSGRKLYSL